MKSATHSPSEGFRGLAHHWRDDFSAGFTLFLLALPLSVGIAIASGVPATAGILAAIVGGIFGSLLGGSFVTINGPAAGLIVIVLSAVTEFGAGEAAAGFRPALAAIAVAGGIQIVLGVARLGVLGLAFPTAVIHGMLMSIGVIIFAKQAHLVVGVIPQSKSIFGLLSEIPQSVGNLNPEIALIGVGSLLIVLFLGRLKSPWLKKVPAPLVAVVYGILMGTWFDLEHQHTFRSFLGSGVVGPGFLLNVPQHFKEAFVLPDFSLAGTGLFWKHALTICIVASIESILSTCAVDKLDPFRRNSNLNRELWSKGVCNTACGFLGGLPIISEIVRSSANVNNGAKTPWSNFFHGVLLLVFVALFPALPHQIPLASLAAVLVIVGWRLGNPAQLFATHRVGWDQSLVMAVTLVVTLGTDLLLGVLAGFLLKIGLNTLRAGSFLSLFRLDYQNSESGGAKRFIFRGALVGTNFIWAREDLNRAVETGNTVVDLTECAVVDHTVMELIEKMEEDAHRSGRKFELLFSPKHRPISSHPLAVRVLV